MAAAHYIEALRLQARTARMHAIFGAKNPHLQSLAVGGVTCVRDLTADRIAEFLFLWKETQKFIEAQAHGILMAFLPAYSPELNPDEQVWNHAKARLGKRSIFNKLDMRCHLISILRSIQKQTSLIKSFFRMPDTAYILEAVA